MKANGTTCTIAGRVVYDRKPHRFSWRDVQRITGRLDLPDINEILTDPRKRADFGRALAVWADLNAKIALYLTLQTISVLATIGYPLILGPLVRGLDWSSGIWRNVLRLTR